MLLNSYNSALTTFGNKCHAYIVHEWNVKHDDLDMGRTVRTGTAGATISPAISQGVNYQADRYKTPGICLNTATGRPRRSGHSMHCSPDR